MVDEIRIIESKKISAVYHEAPIVLESYYDKNNLYQVENMSLDGTEEKNQWQKRALEYQSSYVIENRNEIIYVHNN